MSGHSPAPWSTNARDISVYDSEGRLVADAYGAPYRRPNAALIAAAPDLLAALRECSEYLSMIPESAVGGDDDAVRLAKLADRAIARAEGRDHA